MNQLGYNEFMKQEIEESVRERIAPLAEARAQRMASHDAEEFELEIARRACESQILGRIAFHRYLDSLTEED